MKKRFSLLLLFLVPLFLSAQTPASSDSQPHKLLLGTNFYVPSQINFSRHSIYLGILPAVHYFVTPHFSIGLATNFTYSSTMSFYGEPFRELAISTTPELRWYFGHAALQPFVFGNGGVHSEFSGGEFSDIYGVGQLGGGMQYTWKPRVVFELKATLLQLSNEYYGNDIPSVEVGVYRRFGKME